MNFDVKYGTEVVILSPAKYITKGLIKPGTRGFLNRVFTTAYIGGMLKVYYVDIFRKGYSSRPLVRRVVVPVYYTSDGNRCYIARVAFARKPTNINGNVHKLAALMQSIINRDRSHKYASYVCTKTLERFNKSRIGLNLSPIRPPNARLKLQIVDLMVSHLKGVMSPEELVTFSAIVSNIHNSYNYLNAAIRRCTPLFEKYESEILSAVLDVKYRCMNIHKNNILDIGTEMREIHSDRMLKGYIKHINFADKFIGRENNV